MANWNGLDWVFVAILLASFVTAFWKGLAAELIALGSVAAGIAIAVLDYKRLAPFFEDLTRSHEIALGISFLLLFFGTLALGALISALARKAIQKAELRFFDRFLGGLFGLLRGVLIDSVLLLVLLAFAIKKDAVQQSSLAPYLTSGSRVIAMAMPSKVKDSFQAGFERFRQTLIQADKKELNHANF